MDGPLVSIVITAYNYAGYLATAIESALGQDHVPLEVLVLDNASTDETPAVVARYAHDPRLRSIRHPENVGLTANHNRGLAAARGEYVGFLSADDALAPGFVARTLRFYAEHPDVDVAYGVAYYMDAAGALTAVREWPGEPKAGYAGGRNEFAQLLADGDYMCFPTMLVPRAVWERFGPLDPDLWSADWEICLRWARGGVRFGFIPEPCAFVRMHDRQHSGVADKSGSEMRDYATIFERYLDPARPDLLAGHEAAVRRVIDNRETYARMVHGDVAAFDAATNRFRERIDAIATANAARERQRIAYVVLADTELAPLRDTLDSLVRQEAGDWRAIVVQQPAVSFAAACTQIAPDRTRHVQLVEPCGIAAAVNTAIGIEEADVYAVVRSGTRIAPHHTGALRAAFADPATRVALTWPRFFVDDPAAGTTGEILALSRPPHGGLDVASGPVLAAEGVAFAREAFDVAAGYRDVALADWDFLIRIAMGGAVRSCGGGVEVHVWAGMRDARTADRRLLEPVKAVYRAFPVVETGRLAARAAFLERLQAASAHDPSDAAGLRAFYEALSGAAESEG